MWWKGWPLLGWSQNTIWWMFKALWRVVSWCQEIPCEHSRGGTVPDFVGGLFKLHMVPKWYKLGFACLSGLSIYLKKCFFSIFYHFWFDIQHNTTWKFVRIYFDSPTFDRITKDRAINFVAVLSSIGGSRHHGTSHWILSHQCSGDPLLFHKVDCLLCKEAVMIKAENKSQLSLS